MKIKTMDEKILEWDKVDFDELVSSFTKDEISTMADYLEYASNSYDDRFYYRYVNYNDDSEIVYDYIRRTVYENIGEDRWNIDPKWISVLLAI